MQSLPNCAPDGTDACRLTYAVELRPKGFLPVKLIEGRIAMDLRQNIGAIRKNVENRKRMRQQQQQQQLATANILVQAPTTIDTGSVTAMKVKRDEISQVMTSSSSGGGLTTAVAVVDGSTQELLKAVLNTIKSNNNNMDPSVSVSSISTTRVVKESNNDNNVVIISQDESVTKTLSTSNDNNDSETADVNTSNETRFSFRRYFGLTKLLGEPQDNVRKNNDRDRDENDDNGTKAYSSDWSNSNTVTNSSSDKIEENMSVEELKEAYMKLKLENNKLKNQIIKQQVIQTKNDELSE